MTYDVTCYDPIAEHGECVIAVDPGNTKSAFVLFDDRPRYFGKWDNHVLLRAIAVDQRMHAATHCAIETIKPRGMPTSFEEMQTQLWAGRFFQAWYDRSGGEKFGSEPSQVFRADVKMHHCGRATAKDSNIRQSLIDRFGGEELAIGGVKCRTCNGKGWRGRGRPVCQACDGGTWLYPPGPLNGIVHDCWSALAIAVYWSDTRKLRLLPILSPA